MSEQGQQQDDQQGQQDQQQQDGQQGQQQTPGPVPYERFKQVNDALREMQERLAQVEEERKEAEERELKEKEDWKTLAEKREAEEICRRFAAERLARLRLQVATMKGIPVAMADRLRGETEEELLKDADVLLPLLRPVEGPGVPPAGRGGQAQKFDLTTMSPEEIRKNRAAILAQMRSE